MGSTKTVRTLYVKRSGWEQPEGAEPTRSYFGMRVFGEPRSVFMTNCT